MDNAIPGIPGQQLVDGCYNAYRYTVINRIRTYFRELMFAFATGGNPTSRARLALATLRYHALPKRWRDPTVITFDARINGRTLCISLRPAMGDLFIFYEVQMHRVYDTRMLTLPVNARIVDLGANVGMATLYFATAHPTSRIMAVEPHPSTFAMLRRNTQSFGDRVVLKQCAAVSSSGPRFLTQSDAAYNTRLSADGIPVAGLSMRELLSETGFETVDLLKIDIEGGEAELFAGDTSWLDRVNALMIELHGNFGMEQLRGSLELHGMQIISRPGETVTAVRSHHGETQ